jgi:hypothetical protein
MRFAFLRHAVVASLAVLCPMLAPLPAAAGSDDPPTCPAGTVPTQPPTGGGWICIPAADPGEDPGPGGSDPGDGDTTSGSSTCYDRNGADIPCTNADGGVWNASRQCYAYPLVPQPPADSQYWEGHAPSEGNVWTCDRSVAIPGNTWFVPGAEAPADPGQLAKSVVESMPLVKPAVHLAPKPPLMTYVGLATWLWMDQNQWHKVTGSATAGPTTVTVVAEPIRVTWDLGDGIETCTSAGREWQKGMSSEEHTDCSFVFQRVSDFEPGGSFKVTAVISYAVNWTCSGTCLAAAGTLGEVPGFPSDAVPIRVGERQSVVIR